MPAFRHQTLPHVNKHQSEPLGLLLGLTQASFCLEFPNYSLTQPNEALVGIAMYPRKAWGGGNPAFWRQRRLPGARPGASWWGEGIQAVAFSSTEAFAPASPLGLLGARGWACQAAAYRAETGCPLAQGSMFPAERRKRLSAGESRWRNIGGQRELVQEKQKSRVAIMSACCTDGVLSSPLASLSHRNGDSLWSVGKG